VKSGPAKQGFASARVITKSEETVYDRPMLDILDEFKRPIQGRIAYFLFLIPFIPAAWPLVKQAYPMEIFFYMSGFFLILGLIIYSAQRPFIICRKKALQINLPYRHEPEIHEYDEILGYKIRKDKIVILNSINHKEIKFSLNRKECKRFAEILETQGVFRQNEK